MNPNLVILAGGVSSRMKKVTHQPPLVDARLQQEALSKSKSMIGVGYQGTPLMDYVLFNAREAGYRDIVIVVGKDNDHVREHYGHNDRDNSFHGLNISYAVQTIPSGRTKPLGTADALLQALHVRDDWRGQRLTACNSDNLYSRNAFRLLLHDKHSAALIDYHRDALQCEQSRIEHFSVIQKNSDGYLTAIIEKPSSHQITLASDPEGRVGVSMNIFRFTYDDVVPYLETVQMHPVRQEKELPQAIMMMIADNPRAMFTIPLSEAVPDLTHQDDIRNVQEYLQKEFPNFSFS